MTRAFVPSPYRNGAAALEAAPNAPAVVLAVPAVNPIALLNTIGFVIVPAVAGAVIVAVPEDEPANETTFA